MTTRQVIDTLKTLIHVLEAENSVIDDFHEYAQAYGGSAGGNVFEFGLRDALRLRGLTLEQFRAERQKRRQA